MDPLVINAKLESLRHCLRRVEEKTPENAHQLAQDADLQDILVLNLTRAVQLCVDIGSHIVSQSNTTAPVTMGGIFEALEKQGIISIDVSDAMRRAVGFRNIAVHNYDTIDWEIVFAISTNSLKDFQAFAKAVLVAMGTT